MIKRSGSMSIEAMKNFDIPKVQVALDAYQKMVCYIDMCSKEIAWLGHIKELDGGIYLLDDVFLIGQEVGASTVSFTEEGLAKFMTDMISTRGIEYYNEIRLWGHSHVNMQARPSGQDNRQISDFKDQEYYIMLIMNKGGDGYVEFHDFEGGLIYKNIPIQVVLPNSEQIYEQAQADFKRNISEPKPVRSVICANDARQKANNSFEAKNYKNSQVTIDEVVKMTNSGTDGDFDIDDMFLDAEETMITLHELYDNNYSFRVGVEACGDLIDLQELLSMAGLSLESRIKINADLVDIADDFEMEGAEVMDYIREHLMYPEQKEAEFE